MSFKFGEDEAGDYLEALKSKIAADKVGDNISNLKEDERVSNLQGMQDRNSLLTSLSQSFTKMGGLDIDPNQKDVFQQQNAQLKSMIDRKPEKKDKTMENLLLSQTFKNIDRKAGERFQSSESDKLGALRLKIAQINAASRASSDRARDKTMTDNQLAAKFKEVRKEEKPLKELKAVMNILRTDAPELFSTEPYTESVPGFSTWQKFTERAGVGGWARNESKDRRVFEAFKYLIAPERQKLFGATLTEKEHAEFMGIAGIGLTASPEEMQQYLRLVDRSIKNQEEDLKQYKNKFNLNYDSDEVTGGTPTVEPPGDDLPDNWSDILDHFKGDEDKARQYVKDNQNKRVNRGI